MPSIEITSVGKRHSILGVEFRMHKKAEFQIKEPIRIILGNADTGKAVEIDISDIRKDDIPAALQSLNGHLIESYTVSMTPAELSNFEAGHGELLIRSGNTNAPLAGIGQTVSPDQTGMKLHIHHSLD